MTPDTCPYCGAPRSGEGRKRIYWSCGTNSARQGRQCARYVRTRISQLRRMAHTAWLRAAHHPLCLVNGRRDRYNRFAAACLREIDRLRGGA